MIRVLKNGEIYSLWEKYSKVDFSTIYIPVGVNFYIQKNFLELENKYAMIQTLRQKIAEKFGDYQEDGTYRFSAENLKKANKELEDLEQIKEEINIINIPLSDIKDVEMSTEHLQALMFMLVDDSAYEKED